MNISSVSSNFGSFAKKKIHLLPGVILPLKQHFQPKKVESLDDALSLDGVEPLSLLKLKKNVSSVDPDECVRTLREACVLMDCLRNHRLWDEYLKSADDSVLHTLPAAIDFLKALSFDIDDYLAATPFSHEWMREHGHGD
jgi:hypothetical protein